MPPAPISPTNQIITNSILETSRSNQALRSVVLGEILPTTVMEKLAGNKYLLALNNLHIEATSTIPLNVGEKLVVKVDSLQPQIVLTIVENQNQSSDANVNESLRQWRSNPESFLQVISKVAEFAKLVQTGDLPLKLANLDLAKLVKLFDNIIFSSRTKNNPLFLQEFVAKTGLLLENTLKQLVAQAARGISEKPLEDNLKSLLLKLASAVEDVLQEKSKLDSQISARLTNIAAFTDEALKSLETRQVINTVFQDSDNGLVLQIPVALAEGFRLADIFITPEEKNEQGKRKFSSCSVAVFLDLDILGEIVVSANVREGGFGCVIKCAREDVKDLINEKLDELKISLAKTGYRVDYVDCIQAEGLRRERDEFLAGQSFSAVDLVNYFV
jgi:hypothetical protein